jgi:hypothetical protein
MLKHRPTLFLALLLALCAQPCPGQLKPVYPGLSWEKKTPAEASLKAESLDALRELVGGHGCVIRHGYLVYSWGDIARRGDVASACKPWFIHFLLLLLQNALIDSLDDAVHPLEPRLFDLNPKLDFKDRKITWRQLANQTSCYGVREQPGAAFDYSDYNMALLFDTLFLKAYKTSYDKIDEEVLRPKLTDLLGCEDKPSFVAFGVKDRPGRLGVSVRDMARFGLLYLRKGQWGDKRLLEEKLTLLAVSSPLPAELPRTTGKPADMIPKQRSIGGGNNQTDHLGSYSFAWWTNGLDRDKKRHWPDAPPDAYAALGHGGQRALIINPSLELVVCWNDSRIKGREQQNAAFKVLKGAVR